MQKTKLENVKDLCEYIWYLEDKYDLFNLEINGVHPWAAFRMDLYYEIGKRHGIFDKDLVQIHLWHGLVPEINMVGFQTSSEFFKIVGSKCNMVNRATVHRL